MNTKVINDIEIKAVRLPKNTTEVFGSDILPIHMG